MSDVTIKVRKNGPYVVTGAAEIVDHEGRPFRVEAGRPVALCRCGQSGHKPFCDGTHSRVGFRAEESAG